MQRASTSRLPTTCASMIAGDDMIDCAMQGDWRGAWVAVFALAMLPIAVGWVYEERLFDREPDTDMAVVCFWPTLYALILCDIST